MISKKEDKGVECELDCRAVKTSNREENTTQLIYNYLKILIKLI